MLNNSIKVLERIWIFQCNPNKYIAREAFRDKEVINCFHWKVKQHKNEIANGHIGLIWCSGNSAGIIASTKLISDPGEFNESEAEKKYWIDDHDERGKQIRVKMRLLRLLDNPIEKRIIKVTDGLQDLSILKMPRGTNFPVTPHEWTNNSNSYKYLKQRTLTACISHCCPRVAVVITFGYLVLSRPQSAIATQRLIHADVSGKQK